MPAPADKQHDAHSCGSGRTRAAWGCQGRAACSRFVRCGAQQAGFTCHGSGRAAAGPPPSCRRRPFLSPCRQCHPHRGFCQHRHRHACRACRQPHHILQVDENRRARHCGEAPAAGCSTNRSFCALCSATETCAAATPGDAGFGGHGGYLDDPQVLSLTPARPGKRFWRSGTLWASCQQPFAGPAAPTHQGSSKCTTPAMPKTLLLFLYFSCTVESPRNVSAVLSALCFLHANGRCSADLALMAML